MLQLILKFKQKKYFLYFEFIIILVYDNITLKTWLSSVTKMETSICMCTYNVNLIILFFDFNFVNRKLT